MNEYDAIPMDAPVEYDGGNELPPAGEYFFTVCDMKRKQVEKTDKMPPHVDVRYLLRLEDGSGHTYTLWDDIRMYQKWVWKYAELARSIGHTAPDDRMIRIDWPRFVGSGGRCQVTLKDWTRHDGTTEKQAQVKYLLPQTAPEPATSGDMPF